MSGRALLVAEDRVLALRPVLCEAFLAAVQPAVEAKPPVPAARRLKEIATDRPHRAQLRGGRLRARLPQRLRDLWIELELCQWRSPADAVPGDPPRHNAAYIHERLGLDQPVAHER